MSASFGFIIETMSILMFTLICKPDFCFKEKEGQVDNDFCGNQYYATNAVDRFELVLNPEYPFKFDLNVHVFVIIISDQNVSVFQA